MPRTAHVFGAGKIGERGLSRLQMVAKECFEKAHRKHEAAVELLVKEIRKDKALESVAIRRAAVQAIQSCFVTLNANADLRRHETMLHYPGPALAPDPVREEAMKQVGADILREFVKPQGKFLRDLTKEQLLATVEDRKKGARTMRARTRFYEMLAEGMKAGQKVSERYTGEELVALRQQAEKEITD